MNSYRDETLNDPAPLPNEGKKQYTQPILEAYGDIRDLTLGTSMGGRESGGTGGNTKKT